MGTEGSRYEQARMDVPRTWSEIVSITDKSLRFGFRPLAVHLMVLKIIEGQCQKTMYEALESNAARRVEQIQNAFTERVGLKTIPVGIIVVGETSDGTNRGIDEVVLVTNAVATVAEIMNQDVEELTRALGAAGATIASEMLRSVGVVPSGGVDVITEIPWFAAT
jgi:hypothetical protein